MPRNSAPAIAMDTRIRRFFICILVVLDLLARTPTGQAAEPLETSARPVALDPEHPERGMIGALTYLSGIDIRSPDARFGGISAILVDNGGSGFLAVTDAGDWIAGNLIYDAKGRLMGVGDARIGRLPGADGQPLKADLALGDAESLARLPNGSVVVAFERAHRLWLYGPNGTPFAAKPIPLATPPELRRLPLNNGIEALTAFADGRLLMLAEERSSGSGPLPAWIHEGNGGWRRLEFPPAGDFRPTGATTLNSGEVLVLERRYNPIDGPAARLRRITAAEIAEGRLQGREVAEIALPLSVDNFEAIAAWEGKDGRTRVLIVSDDNFSGFQRTLALLFELAER